MQLPATLNKRPNLWIRIKRRFFPKNFREHCGELQIAPGSGSTLIHLDFYPSQVRVLVPEGVELITEGCQPPFMELVCVGAVQSITSERRVRLAFFWKVATHKTVKWVAFGFHHDG